VFGIHLCLGSQEIWEWMVEFEKHLEQRVIEKNHLTFDYRTVLILDKKGVGDVGFVRRMILR